MLGPPHEGVEVALQILIEREDAAGQEGDGEYRVPEQAGVEGA